MKIANPTFNLSLKALFFEDGLIINDFDPKKRLILFLNSILN